MISGVTQGNNSTPEFLVKRKRGRPRKDESVSASGLSGSDTVKRNQRRRVSSTDGSDNALVGQIVSGVLDGSFDAGYLLTVRVGGTGTLLRGVVFDPGLSVPVTAANDVAPHVNMIKRSDVPLGVVAPHRQTPLAEPQRTAPKPYQQNTDVASTCGSSPNQLLQGLDKCDHGASINGVAINSSHIYQNLTPTKQSESTTVLKANLVSNQGSASQFDEEKILGKLSSNGTSAITTSGSDNKSDQYLQNNCQISPPKVMVQSSSKVADVSDVADGDLPGDKQASVEERDKMIPECLERDTQIKNSSSDVAALKGVNIELTNVSTSDNLQENGNAKRTPGAVDQEIKLSRGDFSSREISKSLVTSENSSLLEAQHKESAQSNTIEARTSELSNDGQPSLEDSICEPRTEQSGPAAELLPTGIKPPVSNNKAADINTVGQSINSRKLANEEFDCNLQSDAPMSEPKTYQQEVISSTENDLSLNEQFVSAKVFVSQIPDPTGLDLLDNDGMQTPGMAVDSEWKKDAMDPMNVSELKIGSQLENLPENTSGSI